MNFIHHAESECLSPSLKGSPAELIEHVPYAGCVVVSAKNKSRCPTLHHLELIDVSLCGSQTVQAYSREGRINVL